MIPVYPTVSYPPCQHHIDLHVRENKLSRSHHSIIYEFPSMNTKKIELIEKQRI